MQTSDEKREERTRALARRADAFAVHGPTAGERLAAHGLDFLSPTEGAIVSGFAAIRDEIDPALLLARLHGEGYSLTLPVMQGRGKALLFRAWAPGDEMGKVQWGIAEPLPDKPQLEPDIVLVPLLAFDEAGYRLGYGGGFYDRSLEQLRAIKPVIAVGIAYDELKVDAVPHLHYDQPLDWVLTPSGPLRCSGT